MKKSTLLFLMITLYSLIHAQSITSVSEKIDLSLPKVSMAYDFDQPITKINNPAKDIDTIPIRRNKPGKYLYMKGNFTTYATLNNTINGYADGIITYIFDRKTKKLKSTRIEQYRIFRMPKPEWDPQKFSSWDYAIYMHVPRMKGLVNINSHKKTKNPVFYKSENGKRDKIEIKEERLQEKGFAILGYHLFDVRHSTDIIYTGNSRKQPEDLLEYKESSSMKVKYKNEPMYNIVNVFTNFYPTAVDSDDNKNTNKIKFDINQSCYTAEYWKDPSFPNMQSALNAFLKEELIEKQNINSLNT
ncbi:hypothetical protein [uncultured Chryseobacterium sp.]|uniref:hypothetical protein n=1 Tax=uncultured Chryseobacterium sp. TaxID=259322 RepID=UPI0025E0177B|nr:hypothetical protein [uncultured Chryseobacterium sp.]